MAAAKIPASVLPLFDELLAVRMEEELEANSSYEARYASRAIEYTDAVAHRDRGYRGTYTLAEKYNFEQRLPRKRF